MFLKRVCAGLFAAVILVTPNVAGAVDPISWIVSMLFFKAADKFADRFSDSTDKAIDEGFDAANRTTNLDGCTKKDLENEQRTQQFIALQGQPGQVPTGYASKCTYKQRTGLVQTNLPNPYLPPGAGIYGINGGGASFQYAGYQQYPGQNNNFGQVNAYGQPNYYGQQNGYYGQSGYGQATAYGQSGYYGQTNSYPQYNQGYGSTYNQAYQNSSPYYPNTLGGYGANSPYAGYTNQAGGNYAGYPNAGTYGYPGGGYNNSYGAGYPSTTPSYGYGTAYSATPSYPGYSNPTTPGYSAQPSYPGYSNGGAYGYPSTTPGYNYQPVSNPGTSTSVVSAGGVIFNDDLASEVEGSIPSKYDVMGQILVSTNSAGRQIHTVNSGSLIPRLSNVGMMLPEGFAFEFDGFIADPTSQLNIILLDSSGSNQKISTNGAGASQFGSATGSPPSGFNQPPAWQHYVFAMRSSAIALFAGQNQMLVLNGVNLRVTRVGMELVCAGGSAGCRGLAVKNLKISQIN